jgi:hypothetical protein
MLKYKLVQVKNMKLGKCNSKEIFEGDGMLALGL